MVEKFQIAVYAPQEFKETWDRFKVIASDKGSSAARELRAFISDEVDRADIASPQRRMTMYDDMSPDEREIKIAGILQYFEKKAAFDPHFATRKRILSFIQDLAKGKKRVELCDRIIKDLKKRGVFVT